MQNNQNTSLTTSSDSQLRVRCLSWGFPCVIILIISLLAALRIGAGFEQRTFASCISFVVCAMLLGLIYYTLFQSLPISIYYMWASKRNKEDEASEDNEPVDETAEPSTEPLTSSENTDTLEETEPKNDVDVAENADVDIKESTEQIAEPQIPSSPVFNQEYYDNRRQLFLQKQEEERQAKIFCIMDYTRHVMSAIMSKDDIDHLCIEVRNWADNAKYAPHTVHMLPDAIKLDAKHYVWNIAERLGGEHAKICNRSPFIKALFNDMFGNNDLSSLKNLTVKPNEGTIKIDEPMKGSYLFAYQRNKDEE